MKIVLYTQRVEVVESYGERRDCADQNIPCFIEMCGYLPIPVPNVLSVARNVVELTDLAGIILTGGNSLMKYGGNAPERDMVEKELLDFALHFDIPVYGFCRGMQMILDYFGCKLEEVSGHVAVRHEIYGEMGAREVNSFHNQACCEVVNPLKILAQAKDGVIEAIRHKEKPVIGTMWHPERENPYKDMDIKLVQKLFG